MPKWYWFFTAVLLFFAVLGWFNSPLSLEGRPVLLLPDVKRVETYRHQASRWVKQLSALEGQSAVLLSGNRSDPLALSRKAQRLYLDSIRLFEEVDTSLVPQALGGVHQRIQEAIQGQLEVTQNLCLWISDPNELTHAAALTSLESAREELAALKNNAWMQGLDFKGIP
jgi:hypothetical protein